MNLKEAFARVDESGDEKKSVSRRIFIPRDEPPSRINLIITLGGDGVIPTSVDIKTTRLPIFNYESDFMRDTVFQSFFRISYSFYFSGKNYRDQGFNQQ